MLISQLPSNHSICMKEREAAMAEENQSGFKVTDRRLFNPDGSLRVDVLLEEEAAPQPAPAAPTPAPASAAQKFSAADITGAKQPPPPPTPPPYSPPAAAPPALEQDQEPDGMP